MSNNIDITYYEYENICRACLSREDLKPLYEKCFQSTCLVDMLMSCTFVKFAEGDGLPTKICINCINEIKRAFSFAKLCEKTDIILRNCGKNFKTELTDKVESDEESFHRPIAEEDFHFVEIKKEQDENMEFEEYVEDMEKDTKIDIKYDKIFDGFEDESYENEDKDQDETYSEKLDKNDTTLKQKTVYSQITEERSKDQRRNHETVRHFEPNNQTCKKSIKTLDSLKNLQRYDYFMLFFVELTPGRDPTPVKSVIKHLSILPSSKFI